jgi:hypothetical protein
MGHSGESDTVFRKYYELKHILVDTGNIFRKEKPRPEKTEVLSMHLWRDIDVPELPESLLKETFDNDTEMRDLVEARSQIQAQRDEIKDDPEQGYNKVTCDTALECIRRALNRRRIFLKKHARDDFRKKYFENPELVSSQYPSARPPERAWRSDLIDALYPECESEGSALVAIEAVLAHCRSRGAVQKKGYHRLAQPGNTTMPTASNAEPDTVAQVKRKFTAEDTQRLVHLRRYLRLPWQEIPAQFPSWSRNELEYRYRKATASRGSHNGPGVREEPVALAGREVTVQIPASSENKAKQHCLGVSQQDSPKKRPHSSASAPDVSSPVASRKRVCGHYQPKDPLLRSLLREQLTT